MSDSEPHLIIAAEPDVNITVPPYADGRGVIVRLREPGTVTITFPDAAELTAALSAALKGLEVMVDREMGVLSWLKHQGEAQGVPVHQTYDATVELIGVLRGVLAKVPA